MSFPLVIVMLWLAINHVPWIGPWLADRARDLVGPEAVSGVEDWAYRADDRWNRWWRHDEKPIAHWVVPAPTSLPHVEIAIPGDGGVAAPRPSPFEPSNVGSLFREVAATGDGVWIPVADAMHPADPPVVYKTLIHPDRERPWAELFVTAIDLRQTRVQVMAGTIEPVASTDEGERYERRGVVPQEQRGDLVAAFNGGFKAEHGHYGMKVDGITLLPPRPKSCTIVGYLDGTMRIGTWEKIATTEATMDWWRQTPVCMIEAGKLHPGLANEEAKSWGSALGGETVVRRSAVGLDRDRATIYVGVSNATTARAIAIGMQHAGASDLAQLDINWSYPHFVMFRPSSTGGPEGFVLFDGFAYEHNTYLSRRSPRDFFYVRRTTSPR